MRKLSQQELRQVYICQVRIKDVQSRMEIVREIFVKKGLLIGELKDAFTEAVVALKNAETLANDILEENNKLNE